MAERESSVLFSLNELLKMEEQRRIDVASEERARAEDLERKRLEALEAERAAEKARIRAEEDRRRELDLRSAIEIAQIEAHKAVAVEKSSLEIQVRHYADQLAARDAHARELATMLESQRGRGRTSTIVAAVLAVIATAVAIFAVAFATRSKPLPPPLEVPKVADNGAELESTKRKIAALEKEIAELRDKPAPTVTALPPKVVTPPKFVPKPQPTGTICPPGVKGIPMCP